jgi:competence protein ComEC
MKHAASAPNSSHGSKMRFRRTTLLAVFCLSVLCGIGLARRIELPAVVPVVSALVWFMTLRVPRALPAAVVLLGATVGIVRGDTAMARLVQYQPLFGNKIVVVGTAVDDAGYGKQKQLAFDLKNARVDGRGDPLTGKIGVSGFGANEILRGDTVQVEGKIRSGLGSKQAYMSYATLTVLRSRPGRIDMLRRQFAAGMASALPEPEASFAMGLLIGQKATLPATVYQDLVMVGLVHIIAVSGYNLTIILRACLKLLGNRSKYQTFLVAITLIGTFLLITGASASIVRASIVSALSMAAWYYGRTFRPVLLISLAAAITALVNPLYIWSDIGWYLSFLAFDGVMILGPLVSDRFLRGWFARSVVVGIALESLCAEVMTLPLVLYIFGQMSAVSLIANVIVAAFVPLAMLLSLIAGLAGMLMTGFAGWFAWPARYLLTYMLDAAHMLASIPHIFRQNAYLTLAGMLAMYALVVGWNLILYSRGKRNRAIIGINIDTNPLLHAPHMAARLRASEEAHQAV